MKLKHCFSNYMVDLELKKKIDLYKTFLRLKESGYLKGYEPVSGFNSIVFFIQDCFRFEVFSTGKIRVSYWKSPRGFRKVIEEQAEFVRKNIVY